MNTAQIETFLHTVQLFHDVSPEQLRRLAESASETRFATGQAISGTIVGGNRFLVLLEGEGVEYADRGDAPESQARRVYPGDFTGLEMIVVSPAEACRVVATKAVRALAIPIDALQTLYEESPEFVRAVSRALVLRLQLMRDMVKGIRFVHLSSYPHAASTLSLLPRRVSIVCRSLAVEQQGDRVTVALVNPSDVRARSFIQEILGDYQVQFVAISEEDFEQRGRKLLGERIESGPEVTPYSSMQFLDGQGILRPLAGSREDDLLSHMLTVALRRGASDAHFEPYRGQARARLRVDGRMVELDSQISAATYRQLIARIKVLSELDTTRVRRPQDGRFLIQVEDRPVEFRVSTSPCHGGVKVVLRIVAPNQHYGNLSRLVLYSPFERLARELFESPSGMVLVTGPSGAGKTTTLYAALQSAIANVSSKSVVTIEDPVEYDLPFATQIQVNEESRMDFAAILKSVLRQDPDVILVGEIRDPKSAAMAAEAANTGHLVLSSLHTYAAMDAMVRLRDLRVPPYVIAAGLRGVITQQLVPRLEPGFTEDVRSDDPAVRRLIELGVLDDSWNGTLLRGRDSVDGPPGGELGRVGIFEMLAVTPALSAAIDRGATRSELSECLDPDSFGTFKDYAQFLLREGIVAPERILDVVPRAPGKFRQHLAYDIEQNSTGRETATDGDPETVQDTLRAP